jgi:hypothetical protein
MRVVEELIDAGLCESALSLLALSNTTVEHNIYAHTQICNLNYKAAIQALAASTSSSTSAAEMMVSALVLSSTALHTQFENIVSSARMPDPSKERELCDQIVRVIQQVHEEQRTARNWVVMGRIMELDGKANRAVECYLKVLEMNVPAIELIQRIVKVSTRVF